MMPQNNGAEWTMAQSDGRTQKQKGRITLCRRKQKSPPCCKILWRSLPIPINPPAQNHGSGWGNGIWTPCLPIPINPPAQNHPGIVNLMRFSVLRKSVQVDNITTPIICQKSPPCCKILWRSLPIPINPPAPNHLHHLRIPAMTTRNAPLRASRRSSIPIICEYQR